MMRLTSASEKGIRLAQTIATWPIHAGGNTAIKEKVGPASGPTWRLSHCGATACAGRAGRSPGGEFAVFDRARAVLVHRCERLPPLPGGGVAGWPKDASWPAHYCENTACYKRLKLVQLLGQLGVFLTRGHDPHPADSAQLPVAAMRFAKQCSREHAGAFRASFQ
jgi:hypothetical protein